MDYANRPCESELAVDGEHVPDLATVTVEDGIYLDVKCIHCGEAGCLGTIEDLIHRITW